MSEQFATDDVIPHGEQIVERFGGIRPMATKLNVPVTTVQGWKKRDAIPAGRKDEIVSAANLHGIDLKGLIGESANQNTPAEKEKPAKKQTTATPEIIDLNRVRRAAFGTSLATSGAICVILLGTGFLLFSGNGAPQNNALEARIGAVETRLNDTAALSGTIADLQTQIGAVRDGLSERMTSLEQQLSALGAGNLADMTNRAQAMAATPQGRAQWTKAIAELKTTVANLQGRTDGLEQALNHARGQNDSLGRTLTDISGRDLEAAAMLLALTQLREAADRETPFTEDLALLRQVAQGADPALAASVDKLAPYAATGILSPEGLRRELLATAGDIIAAKARGENVSIKDKILTRLRALFTIRKDGMPMGAGDDRALIGLAAAQLDKGDVAGAIATMDGLQGPAAQAAQPWQEKAQATLTARRIDSQLATGLMTRIKGALSGAPQPIDLAPQAAPPVATPDAGVVISQ